MTVQTGKGGYPRWKVTIPAGAFQIRVHGDKDETYRISRGDEVVITDQQHVHLSDWNRDEAGVLGLTPEGTVTWHSFGDARDRMPITLSYQAAEGEAWRAVELPWDRKQG